MIAILQLFQQEATHVLVVTASGKTVSARVIGYDTEGPPDRHRLFAVYPTDGRVQAAICSVDPEHDHALLVDRVQPTTQGDVKGAFSRMGVDILDPFFTHPPAP